MALVINGGPVLDAQATLEFFERVEEMAVKESQRTKEELEERKKERQEISEYLSRQKNL
jgi:hypothetical protein